MSDVRGQRAGRDGGPRGDPGEPGGGLAARRWRLPVRVRQAGGTAQQNAKVLHVTSWKSLATWHLCRLSNDDLHVMHFIEAKIVKWSIKIMSCMSKSA